ncbi:MAG: bifunctional UDP-N-acetylglucosamine diphosphorylase/glucosamine-1-phosphate N-acetyltransferase GlmU [Mycobacteriales bacterium]
MAESLAVIVLAAGASSRMKSAIPKYLHPILGRTMLGHILAAVAPLDAAHTKVVVHVAKDDVVASLEGTDAEPVEQDRIGGTGHATRLAMEAIPDFAGTVVVVPGDAPLLRPETLTALIDTHRATGALATVLSANAPDPTGYGRIIRDSSGAVTRIVEERDADANERRVTEINSSVYAFAAGPLRTALGKLRSDNAQHEEYLTDVVKQYVDAGSHVAATVTAYDETAGINDRLQLAEATAMLRDRIHRHWMRDVGVSMIDPASTWIDVDVRLARDVEIGPGVQLRGATVIGEGAVIGPDCTLTDTRVGAGAHVVRAHADHAVIGAGCSVGPFAYLRPGAVVEDGAKIGTYFEVKAATVGAGSAVPHLSYVGNATIGAGVNIGAGTVFANYDGVTKRESVVEDHAKTGAHNCLVAPAHVGAGAYTGAGTVIKGDVPAGALAVSEGGKMRVIEGWTERMRAGTPAAAAAAAAAHDPAAAAAHDPAAAPAHDPVAAVDDPAGAAANRPARASESGAPVSPAPQAARPADAAPAPGAPADPVTPANEPEHR